MFCKRGQKMKPATFQAWFEDFVMRARSKLAEGGIEVEYIVMYEALRRTMTVADVLIIMEQEKAA
jgi:hypothetical protein